MKSSYIIFIIIAAISFSFFYHSNSLTNTKIQKQYFDSKTTYLQESLPHPQPSLVQASWLQIIDIFLGPFIALVSVLFSAYFVAISLKNNRLSKFFDNMVEIDKDLNKRVWGFDDLSESDLEDLKYLTRILDSYCGARQLKIIKARFYQDDMMAHIMSLPNNQKLWEKYIKPKMYSQDGFVATIDRTIAFSKLTDDLAKQEFIRANPNISLLKSIKDYLTPDSV